LATNSGHEWVHSCPYLRPISNTLFNFLTNTSG
jgi:hypothetical protein